MKESDSKSLPMDLLDKLWEKATKIEGLDPAVFRKDPCGAIISRTHFRQPAAMFAWDLDHIFPVSRGGDDREENLRPMHLLNIEAKGDSYPIYHSAVTMDLTSNKPFEQEYAVRKETQQLLSQIYPE